MQAHGKTMSLIVGTALGALIVSMSFNAGAQGPSGAGKYGALAVDRGNAFAYGFSYDHESRAAATAFALSECKKRDGNCQTVVEFAGPGCAAYRTISASDGTAYGWGAAPKQGIAEQRAAQECSTRAGTKSCANSVWACNSGAGAFRTLRMEPVGAAPASTDCLVQYEVDLQRGSQWVTRFYGPVYRFAARDCPLPGKSMHHSFFAFGDGREPREVNEDRKDAAKQARGFAWARDHQSWVSARSSPIGGLSANQIGHVIVSDATRENLDYLVEQVASQDAGDPGGISAGWCVGHTPPPGVTPIETLGAEKCRNWWR